MTQLDSAFIEHLKTLAKKEAAVESDDYMEGSIDAFAGGRRLAYSIGLDDGEIMLAREVLEHLEIKWK